MIVIWIILEKEYIQKHYLKNPMYGQYRIVKLLIYNRWLICVKLYNDIFIIIYFCYVIDLFKESLQMGINDETVTRMWTAIRMWIMNNQEVWKNVIGLKDKIIEIDEKTKTTTAN